MKRWLSWGAWLAVLASGNQAWAAPELHVQFHMGASNGKSQQVGGTLINGGDKPIAQGFLVVTPIDARCRPGSSVLQAIGSLLPGEQQQFRVPVSEPFARYSLHMAAFDGQGFAVLAVDDNQLLLDSRLDQEREECGRTKI